MKNYLKLHCDDESLYKNDQLIQSLTKMFLSTDKEFSKMSHQEKLAAYTQEVVGNYISSASKSSNVNHITKLEGVTPLLNWMIPKIIECSDFFGIKDAKNLNVRRIWANILFKDAQVKFHTHFDAENPSYPVGVAIFYLNSNDSSSQLVINENAEIGKLVEDYKREECEFVKVLSGDMILHNTSIPHAVSKHEIDEPRVCLVCDFSYI